MNPSMNSNSRSQLSAKLKWYGSLLGIFIFNSLAVYFLLLNSSCQSVPKTKNAASTTASAASAATSSQDMSLGDIGILGQAKQLTFVGPRAGEGYFSADGKRMIFQSERDANNPFYQIYLMDLPTGKTQLVSPGQGKTTCSWIHPTQNKVMFASTHLDPAIDAKVKAELQERKAPKRKYAWDYDETFDIFEYDLTTKKYKQLTHEKGYDAEGNYSPDGEWIVFASNRKGYTEKLNEDEQKKFAMDPSYMMDIYIMKADGSQVKQLTNVRGYDGGPFFSHDGRKITWRRFTPDGMIAEVWTMNREGSDQKQLTHLGAMSWAPYFHPSGDYLIFTTNKLGYTNFELYIVDAKGTKDPVRVSFWDGFDGLPVFTPDGKKLAWTHRNEKGESQIYWASWDDHKARQALGLSETDVDFPAMTENIDADDAKQWVAYLASDTMKGRKTGSPEEQIYTQKISNFFERLKLQPWQGKQFTLPFEFTAGVNLGTKNSLSVSVEGKVKTLTLEKDFTPLTFSKSGKFDPASVVFAGYGIVAPATEKQALYDSYKGISVQGKWVLAFRDIPEDISNEKRIHLNMYSRLHHKAMVAKQRGAVGLILVSGPNSNSRQKLIRFRYDGSFAEAGLPVISLTDEVAEELLKSTKKNLKQWQSELDKGELIAGMELPQVNVSGEVELVPSKAKGINVVAKLEVPGAKGTILIGAHGDHLGFGDTGSSLARGDEQGQVHYGADDNASGVAALLELAQFFASDIKKNSHFYKYNLAFAVWSGEEIGILGSADFAKRYKQDIFAYLNMDMVGRLRDKLLVQGVGSAKQWKNIFEEIASSSTTNLSLSDDPYLPTDSMAFYMQEVPAISFFTGSHTEYHTPRDRVETLNYPGIVETAGILHKTVAQLMQAGPKGLTYSKVESSRMNMEGRGFRIYLGTVPDYSQEGVKGVRITGTSKDSPAEKAGLKAGDVIVELAGTKIENIYDYTYCLQSIKANQNTSIKVLRAGRTEELSITPKQKE